MCNLKLKAGSIETRPSYEKFRMFTLSRTFNEPPHDKTNKMCAPSEDSDQPGQMPRLICIFAWRTLILLVLSCRGSFLIKL